MRHINSSRSNALTRLPALAVGLAMLAACASTDVAERSTYEGDLTKPTRVVIYDFSATPQDVPADSALAGIYSKRELPQTEEEQALGRKLGARSAELLVEQLNELGIDAVRAADGGAPRIGEGVVKGAFVSVDEGSQWQRMLIGFGAGANELITIVEGYKMRDEGLVPLGSAKIKAEGGYMPGVLVPVGAGAATGNVARSAIISGGANVVKEFGPESIENAADRTAEQATQIIRDAYIKRGWLEE